MGCWKKHPAARLIKRDKMEKNLEEILRYRISCMEEQIKIQAEQIRDLRDDKKFLQERLGISFGIGSDKKPAKLHLLSKR